MYKVHWQPKQGDYNSKLIVKTTEVHTYGKTSFLKTNDSKMWNANGCVFFAW